MSMFDEGNEIIMRCLLSARRCYAARGNTDYMLGWYDGQLMTIVINMCVDHFIYEGVVNEIHYLQRRAAERNGTSQP